MDFRHLCLILFPVIHASAGELTAALGSVGLRFVDAYSRGLTGPEAAWASRKYRGHRTLPDSIFRDLMAESSCLIAKYTIDLRN
ncbi:hypothetical protein BDZ89DRAFT_972142 [Hymenopellis radicata]|nr:hypothetical protein BDZ89DRAFT_972142 [Hymenopellis radicata]